MATISSHILDSIKGTHAAGIRCQLKRLAPGAEVLFDVNADHEGRINETLHLEADQLGGEFELVIHAAEYFQLDAALVPVVVIRFVIRDAQRRYHLPVMLSPHACSTWWSA